MLRITFLSIIVLFLRLSSIACDVDFPGTSNLTFSGACGSATNLNVGNSTPMGDGDTFTFDSPSTINISGNFNLKADGDGIITIPVGVVVNVSGGMQFDGDGGCNSSSSCSFELIINGTLNVNGGNNFQNNLEELTISGTGTFDISGEFENSSNGCAMCGASSCPAFPDSDCSEGGGNPCGTNFCGADGNIGNNTPLPIDLLYFKATSKNGDICLDWATATEVNNDYFTIERSKDGLNFELVDYLSGQGNSNETIYYSLTDKNPYGGISYYRLTQTDFDGKFEVFPIQLAESIPSPFRIYPTNLKVGDSFAVDVRSFPENQFPMEIQVQDISGKVVRIDVLASPSTHLISTINLSKTGVYLVRINGEFTGRINLN